MSLQAFDVALETHPVAGASRSRVLDRRDPDLAKQVRRAAASVPLNLSEGNRRSRQGPHPPLAQSPPAAPTRSPPACAWRRRSGTCRPPGLARSLALCDRVLAMLWRLTH